MPVTLALQPVVTPRSLSIAVRLPLWRRLHAIADATRLQLQTLWRTVVLDFRRGLSRRRLRAALTSPILFDVEMLWRAQWERTVDRPVRQLLPVLVSEALTAGAQATMPEVARMADDEESEYVPGLPDTQQAIDGYVGEQVRLLWGTTLLALRQARQYSRAAEMSETVTAQWLQVVAGLTPRQVQTIERQRERLQAAGQTQAQIIPQLARQATVALQQRVQGIAASQSMTSVNLGTQDALEQTVRRGLLRAAVVRRYWIVTPDERLCARCLAVASTNATGVGLYEPFQSSEGALMGPPLHAWCRCVVSVGREVTHA